MVCKKKTVRIRLPVMDMWKPFRNALLARAARACDTLRTVAELP